MTRGLIFGKFAPFHRGHESLVQRSLETCDETVVLVYDSPDVTRIPLETRCGWIRKIFPSVRVIAGVGAPAESGRDLAIMRLQEQYIRSIVPLPISHFFSSEWYGEHVSHALGAKDIRVDEARALVQISGSLLRSDPFRHRHLVSPTVYRDLIRRVVLVGAESTGKSMLAEKLARVLHTVHVPEYGREFWIRHHDERGQLSPEQLVRLALEHRQREEVSTRNANRILIVDTDARTTRQYSRWYHSGHVAPQLDRIADEAPSRYHLTILCGDEIPLMDDGTRAGPVRRAAAQQEIRAELAKETTDWIEAQGDLDLRANIVIQALAERGFLTWC